MPLQRVQVAWTGFIGGPGVSTHYFLDAGAAVDDLRSFYATVASMLPGDVHILVPAAGDSLDVETGAITGAWTGPSTAVVDGSDSGSYASTSGPLVRWETGTIVGGRRLLGRTYLVPAGRDAYDGGGQIAGGIRTTIADAGQTFIDADTANLLVWQRPRAAAAAYTDRKGVVHPAITGRVGSAAAVVSCFVPSAPAVLRSRRD